MLDMLVNSQFWTNLCIPHMEGMRIAHYSHRHIQIFNALECSTMCFSSSAIPQKTSLCVLGKMIYLSNHKYIWAFHKTALHQILGRISSLFFNTNLLKCFFNILPSLPFFRSDLRHHSHGPRVWGIKWVTDGLVPKVGQTHFKVHCFTSDLAASLN